MHYGSALQHYAWRRMEGLWKMLRGAQNFKKRHLNCRILIFFVSCCLGCHFSRALTHLVFKPIDPGTAL
jgi:hypothetical protein